MVIAPLPASTTTPPGVLIELDWRVTPPVRAMSATPLPGALPLLYRLAPPRSMESPENVSEFAAPHEAPLTCTSPATAPTRTFWPNRAAFDCDVSRTDAPKTERLSPAVNVPSESEIAPPSDCNDTLRLALSDVPVPATTMPMSPVTEPKLWT